MCQATLHLPHPPLLALVQAQAQALALAQALIIEVLVAALILAQIETNICTCG